MEKTLLKHVNIYVLCLFVSIALGAFGQLSLKLGASHLALSSLRVFLTKNMSLFFGVGLYGVSLIFYIFSLRHIPLNLAFPSVSLSYVCVVLFSHFFLHETISWHQIAGLLIIVTGVCFLWA